MDSCITSNLSYGHNKEELCLNTMRVLANAAEQLETKLAGECTHYEKLKAMLAPVALLKELKAPSAMIQEYAEVAELYAFINENELMAIINPFIIRNVMGRNDKPDRYPDPSYDISNEIESITSIQQKRMGYLAPLIYIVAEGNNGDPTIGNPDPVEWALRSSKTDESTVSFAIRIAIEAGYPSNIRELKVAIDSYDDYSRVFANYHHQ